MNARILKIQRQMIILGLLVSGAPTLASGVSPRELRFWTQLYQELNPNTRVEDSNGRDVDWPRGGPRAWAKVERERSEPVVTAILRGEHDDIPWKYALSFAAPLMPTPAVRDEVYSRLESLFSQELEAKLPLDEPEHGLLANMIFVLAAADDPRAINALNEVLTRHEYSYHIGRKYLLAIRRIGDESSVQRLRDMPLRRTHKEIDRMAKLTERIIGARIDGRAFPPETAQEELRELLSNLVQAQQSRDLAKFRNLFPTQVRDHVDEEGMKRFWEWDERRVFPAIQGALNEGASFEIDEDIGIDQEYFQAKLLCEDRYAIEFIYEVDGWKVVGFEPIRPVPRADGP